MILIGNGRVITMNPQEPILEDGGVVIEGSEIRDVGCTGDLKEKYFLERFIDARGRLIMPGMINTHTHFYSSFARGMALPGDPPTNFMEILQKLWWRLDSLLEDQGIYYSALMGVLECIKNGTTTVFDHHASPNDVPMSLDHIARACTEGGLRACLSYEVSDRDGETVAREGIKENARFGDFCRKEKNPLLAATFGLHASFTLSDATLARCVEEGKARHMGFHIHTAEGQADQEHSQREYGLPVVERLAKAGIWNPRSLAIHCIHITEKEMDMIQEHHVNVIHNPESNMGNAVGWANIPALLERGIPVGMGTDGYTTDMFEGMKVTNLLLKHEQKDPRAGGEVPLLAFDHNQSIVEKIFSQKVGRLQKGWQADVLVLDYLPPTPFTAQTWYPHLLMGVSGGMVDTTVVAGEILMEGRELKTLDEEKVLAQTRKKASEVWKRLS